MNFINTQIPIVSISIILPLVSSIVLAIVKVGEDEAKRDSFIKYLGLFLSCLTLLSTCYMAAGFDYAKPGYQFTEIKAVAPDIGLFYHVAVDGISLLFIILTALLTPICILAAGGSTKGRMREYVISFLALSSFIIAFFSCVNLLLFYIFFEAMLIPMYIIIGCFGGEKRIYAAFKFFLYTFFGSVFFLIALITIYIKTGSFDMSWLTLNAKNIAANLPNWIWLAIFIALAIKVPMVPFHTWLPAAHVQAPTGGSVILAGILLKVGGYGMIRVLLQILPSFSAYYAEYVVALSVFAIVYGAFVAAAQTDMKKMIAYSSVSHMGFVTAGIFSLNTIGLEGAMLQMLSHGFISSGLFLGVGMLYERLHTKEIKAYGGVATRMPVFASFFLVLTMASISLPGTSGFVAELLCFMAIFKNSMYLAIASVTCVVIGALYMLTLYKNLMLGEIVNAKVSKMKDIGLCETSSLLVVTICTVVVGIYPESVMPIFRLGLSGIV